MSKSNKGPSKGQRGNGYEYWSARSNFREPGRWSKTMTHREERRYNRNLCRQEFIRAEEEKQEQFEKTLREADEALNDAYTAWEEEIERQEEEEAARQKQEDDIYDEWIGQPLRDYLGM